MDGLSYSIGKVSPLSTCVGNLSERVDGVTKLGWCGHSVHVCVR